MILPVVLHHGEAGWTGSTAFEDLLDVDDETRAAAGPNIPRFQFILEDICHETDEALRARAAGRGRRARDQKMAQLRVWSMHVLTAPAIDDVFAG